jgi:hypothetical protein
MTILAIMFAGRFGPQPYPGQFVIGFIIIVAVVACISGIVNRRKLDQINKDARSKDEPLKVVGGPWKCPKCGETSEPQFDSCWKCGTVRKNDHAA